MDNKTSFDSANFDSKIRSVIPFYDDLYEQIFRVMRIYFGDKPLSVLDTGCGTGKFGAEICRRIKVSELVLCDPAESMLEIAKERLGDKCSGFVCSGSEKLEFENRFDLVTAIQCHHYFDRATREKAVANCFRALKPGGMFIYFENTAPFTEKGRDIMLGCLEEYEAAAGRTAREIKDHTARYNTEFFPITVSDHLELLRKTGFGTSEIFWFTYMQSGYYGIKN